ncbi:PREDICTED: glucan endo-1,3-beta-glucosidase, basic isoform-like [Nelumbo nucifera]|uniref:Glucan endo-1,3-beta-glucosidase, basic isoform-like n=1 Tax=Nelumbo nucifera TaxID=4432 RepID=A0A1U8Q7F3_NELNU|nr:PREDICTED: glucan endo-1,3-beta-glucosidase, basic isoform-like [Nelumbo nucifera]
MAFQVAVNPPGGVWQDDVPGDPLNTNPNSHKAENGSATHNGNRFLVGRDSTNRLRPQYPADPNMVARDYAVFTAPFFVEEDGNLKYQNLFDAMLGSVYAAIEKISGSSVRIVVSETGWPNVADFVSTTENAQDYLNGLIKHVKGSETPRKPNWPIETYIFAMFDWNAKDGPKLERH